jgi:3-deoxy-manno-octulosonate cytidylyltransferase (CMP-KDO synthetase)
MIEHVYRRASEASGLDAVVVLTDHEDIRRKVESFGGTCEMTPADCRSGTDRIAWAARKWRADAVINVQGDEPLLDPSAITHLAEHLRAHAGEDMVTLAAEVDEDALRDPNQVKVVCGGDGYALYFSRAGIPYRRQPLDDDDDAAAPVLLHVGVYGYRRSVLLRLAELEASPLERSEKLEQLRALENGIRIRVLPVDEAPLGVDTEVDLALAERRMLAMKTTENP